MIIWICDNFICQLYVNITDLVMEVLKEMRVNRERWASPECNNFRKVLQWLDQEGVGEGMVLEFRNQGCLGRAGPGDSVAGTVRWNVESGEGATLCELGLNPEFSQREWGAQRECVSSRNLEDGRHTATNKMLPEAESKRAQYPGCSFLPALQSVNIASHWMNLARNQLAKEPENCSF